MSFPVDIQCDFSIMVASLCGALAWVMNQRYIDRKKKPVLFFISFVMGIFGADLALNIINTLTGYDLAGEKEVGAFFCSALIITFITKLMARINPLPKKGDASH